MARGKPNTNHFVMLPWLKGLDTDTDEGIHHFMKKIDYLLQADDIIFHVDGSKTKRPAYQYHDSAAITNTPAIVGGHDYWANVSNVKTQKIVVGDNQGTSKFWYQSGGGGSWTELTLKTDAEYQGTAPSGSTRIAFEVFNDDLIMAITDTNSSGRNVLKWDNQTGTEYERLGGSPPNFKYIRHHQGRLWGSGDPEFPDRLHFSSPGNAEEWSGIGDSGAIDIDPGDGDSSGITALFPSFRGQLIVAKQNALYRVTGNDPLTYKVEKITSGLGCISHNSAVAIDMDDIYFASERGYHSLVLTEKFGDYEGAFLSKEVQGAYKQCDNILKKFIQGVWIPSLNSVIWNMSLNGTSMDHFWLFDVRYKAWYKWHGDNPTALFRVEDAATHIKRAYFGTNLGRLSKTQTEDVYHDYTDAAYSQLVKTPLIYPDQNPFTIKMFKKLIVWMKMPAGVELEVDVFIPGMSEVQTLTYSSNSSTGAAKLDVDFVLGVSQLGADSSLRMAPFVQPFDGKGVGLQLTFRQANADEYCSIFGFAIEYEDAGDAQEIGEVSG